MTIPLTLTRRSLCLSILSAAYFPSASADAGFPSKPIRLIVPFPPGGGNDAIARFIANRLNIELNQPIIVDNKAGAGGMLGVEAGVSAPADGYTVTLVSPSYTINPSLYKLKFDAKNDIAPIIKISSGAMMVVVNPKLGVTTLAELVKLAKQKPGQINYGSSGQGGIPHLATELFAQRAGIKLTHVPYKGGGPALIDTVSGQVDLCFIPIPPAKAMIAAGKIKALAVTTGQRIAVFADVPTVAEAAGIPGYDVELWHGLIAPKGTPPEIVKRLNDSVRKILLSPDAVDKLAVDGVSPAGGAPEDFRTLIGREVDQWRRLVVQTGVKVD
jgi:tripartite-type tricarboxylate transporter receptor subunit TctC